MRQKSIGEVLKTARESRGWSLTEVQRLTQIQAKYLQALEYNDFAFIPDKVYARNFLERYAEVLDLDSEVLLDAYDTDSLVAYYGVGEEEDFNEELSRSQRGKRGLASYLPMVYLLLAACSILIFVTYVVHSRIQNQVTLSENSSYKVVSQTTTTSSSTASSSSQTSSSSTSSSEQKTALTVSGGGNNLAVQVTNASEPLEVKLSVTDVTSWISVSDTDLAGGTVLSIENKSVTTSLAAGQPTATITLGVVQGVTIEIGGKKVDMSLLTSQTGTITITVE
ncbi:helix-turn-helix domain-containing protein [Streptococcus gallolyticus]|nr:helix-turn-helix domain-containing protein [Streptococcus gallolyticus]MBY5040787.1 helix-turn-helix domain-containing protein [Streptococcus gallolyticus]